MVAAGPGAAEADTERFFFFFGAMPWEASAQGEVRGGMQATGGMLCRCRCIVLAWRQGGAETAWASCRAPCLATDPDTRAGGGRAGAACT